jgi:primosomal protein N' (replication factor Y)
MEVVTLGGDGNAISSRLASEMRDAKDAGRQSILFLNRRGFTHFFRCNTCGYELKCRNCSVPLTWHRKQGVMKCHYCGSQIAPPTSCPECGSLDVGYAGFGTEFIEEEVKRTFPGFSIQRVDTDALTKKGEMKKALDDFRDGKTDILLGTQMVAKGLNFPGVRLVGIALADTSLHMPDFRASERTFSLIVQVAGRAGRFFPDGRVIIQTWNPKAPAIVFASRCDVAGFYAYELAQRAELGFPPFTRLVRLVFRSKKETTAAEGASGAAEILKSLIPADAELMGPAECPIGQISGNWRHQIILRGSALQPLQRAAKKFLTDYKPLQGLYIEADVDPVSLL